MTKDIGEITAPVTTIDVSFPAFLSSEAGKQGRDPEFLRRLARAAPRIVGANDLVRWARENYPDEFSSNWCKVLGAPHGSQAIENLWGDYVRWRSPDFYGVEVVVPKDGAAEERRGDPGTSRLRRPDIWAWLTFFVPKGSLGSEPVYVKRASTVLDPDYVDDTSLWRREEVHALLASLTPRDGFVKCEVVYDLRPPEDTRVVTARAILQEGG